ncbi:MAG: TetR/AcrR family transcriptional regulator [Anaerolineales bacterium]|nr:TetR/AcrR family transcriptional regulator [Anaerolineales bacterium]
MARSATSSRRLKEKEDRKERILAAARDVFFDVGIRRATVDMIAARAEIAKGTVYLYFPTKETILAHLLLEGLDTLNDHLSSAFYSSAQLDGEARLRWLARAYYGYYVQEPDYFRLMMAFDRGQFQESVSAELYELILLRSLRGLRWVVEAAQQGIREGKLAPGDPRQLAGMLWAALNGALVVTSHPLRRELVEQEVETLYAGVLDTMLRGLRARRD